MKPPLKIKFWMWTVIAIVLTILFVYWPRTEDTLRPEFNFVGQSSSG